MNLKFLVKSVVCCVTMASVEICALLSMFSSCTRDCPGFLVHFTFECYQLINPYCREYSLDTVLAEALAQKP